MSDLRAAGQGDPTTSGEAGLPGSVRGLFPVTASRAYLFSGGLAPASVRVTAAIEHWAHRWAFDPADVWDHLFTDWEAVRERLARVLGAPASSIALVDSTSRGANLAVGLLPGPRGGNVVVDATTYPSSLYPWLLPERAGLEVRRAASGAGGIAATLADLEALVDDRTVAVTISHVNHLTGFRHDLRPIADLAHAHGATFIVDLAQSAGIVPLDLTDLGVDLAAGTVTKWLLGPPGIGYLFVSPGLLARTGAPQVGYRGAELDPDDASRVRLRGDARRHELGLVSLLGLPGCRAGLDMILEVGVDAIASHVERLVGRCMDGLGTLGLEVRTPADPAHHAGVVTVTADRPIELQAFLRAHRVDVWALERGRLIRADLHLFNDDNDVDRFLGALEAYRGLGDRDATGSAAFADP